MNGGPFDGIAWFSELTKAVTFPCYPFDSLRSLRASRGRKRPPACPTSVPLVVLRFRLENAGPFCENADLRSLDRADCGDNDEKDYCNGDENDFRH